MKVRNGFVSNSSSCSFCIYGIAVDEDELKSVYEAVKGETDLDSYDIAGAISEETNVEFHKPSYDDTYYFGIDACDVGDNETGAQFKERVKSALSKYFPNKNFSYLEEAWEDR